MSTPAVSVVVPTRGRVGYLEVALASLRAQEVEEPYELLVVDDGARDGTAEVAARLGARPPGRRSPRRPHPPAAGGRGPARRGAGGPADHDPLPRPGGPRGPAALRG